MRLLDLFCGAGGAAKGYQRAGFEVWGVDIKPQPRYCGDNFTQADAFEYLVDLVGGPAGAVFDAVHAAPLWHKWTQQAIANGTTDDHPDQITPLRTLLQETRLPYVLEIGTLTPGDAVTICGVSLGLRVTRHMRFETNWPLMVPPCSHAHGGAASGLYVAFRGSYHTNGWRRSPHRRAAWRAEAEVDWMTNAEADLASPPAYTELIGSQLRPHIEALRVAA